MFSWLGCEASLEEPSGCLDIRLVRKLVRIPIPSAKTAVHLKSEFYTLLPKVPWRQARDAWRTSDAIHCCETNHRTLVLSIYKRPNFANTVVDMQAARLRVSQFPPRGFLRRPVFCRVPVYACSVSGWLLNLLHIVV